MNHDEIIDHLKNNAEYLQELEPNLVKYELCNINAIEERRDIIIIERA